MPDPELNDDFVDFLAALHDEKVDYLVVGAHALAVHGVPRATGDFDVFVRPDRKNARRLLRALKRFGAPVEEHRVLEADFTVPGTVYQMGLPPRRIDVITQISGVAFDEAWRTRVRATLGTQPAEIIGRDSLLKNKRAAARDKDLLDVKLLERRSTRIPQL